MNTEAWDRVHTVNKYYDGPELGVADYRGIPHVYEKQFDTDQDDYSNRFLLSEIEPKLLSLILEAWEIWLRWDTAYRQGEVDVRTHPALPEERPRHEELARLIGDRLRADAAHAVVKWARFRTADRWKLEVQWLDAPAETD